MHTLSSILALTQIDTQHTLPQVHADSPHLQLILGTFFGILAAIAVIVLVIAGLRYVTSGGDPGTMAKTKNTIIYAGVGLVVSMMAFSIVTFVLNGL